MKTPREFVRRQNLRFCLHSSSRSERFCLPHPSGVRMEPVFLGLNACSSVIAELERRNIQPSPAPVSPRWSSNIRKVLVRTQGQARHSTLPPRLVLITQQVHAIRARLLFGSALQSLSHFRWSRCAWLRPSLSFAPLASPRAIAAAMSRVLAASTPGYSHSPTFFVPHPVRIS